VIPAAPRSSVTPRWLQHARSFVGQRELERGRVARFVVDCFRRTRFAVARVTNTTPWCSAFACRVLEDVGIESPKSARARDFLAWKGGRALVAPVPGSICVFRRGPEAGHVGFATDYQRAGKVPILGGNQDNRVCEQKKSTADLLGVFWPKGEPLPPDAVPIEVS
jgi:uncharacterized protein (TIGR02594 family)